MQEVSEKKKRQLNDFDNSVSDRVFLVLEDYMKRNKNIDNYIKLADKIGIHKQKLTNIKSHSTKSLICSIV